MFKKKRSILPKHSTTYSHSTETLGSGGEKKAEQAFRDDGRGMRLAAQANCW